jgi:hypothetical protein
VSVWLVLLDIAVVSQASSDLPVNLLRRVGGRGGIGCVGFVYDVDYTACNLGA